MNKFSTFANMYEYYIQEVFYNFDYISSPRNQKIKEKINVSFELTNPYNNLFLNEIRTPSRKYLAGELLWYFQGDNSLEFIEKYSRFWSNIACEDKSVNSAYGHLIFKETNKTNITEYQWVLESLIKDKDSRQAIMHFNKSNHQYNGVKDFPCTLNVQFMIRENKLNSHIIMRSSDLFFGISYDIPFFSLLHQNTLLLLKNYYHDLQIGSLFFNTMSLHIYEKDFDILEKSLRYTYYNDFIPKMIEPLKPLLGFNNNLNLINNFLYEDHDVLLNWIQNNIKG